MYDYSAYTGSLIKFLWEASFVALEFSVSYPPHRYATLTRCQTPRRTHPSLTCKYLQVHAYCGLILIRSLLAREGSIGSVEHGSHVVTATAQQFRKRRFFGNALVISARYSTVALRCGALRSFLRTKIWHACMRSRRLRRSVWHILNLRKRNPRDGTPE